MSDHEAPYEVRVEPHRIASMKIVFIALAALVIMGLSTVWVTHDLLARRVIEAGIHGPAPADLNGVFQTSIVADHAAERVDAPKRQQLRTYGWVDQSKGIVRIPIDRAMDLVVEEAP